MISQAQPGEPYHLELDVALAGSAGTERHRVTLRERVTKVHLTSPTTPDEVLLDPDHELLIWKPEYGPRPTE